MKNNIINHLNLLNIRPGNITIENFIPGKIYKKAIEIENTSKFPIIINLKASDKSKLLLNKSLLRLEVREKQIVELIIHDKIIYQNGKFPIDPKIISINITGELIDAKYMITLIYIQKYKRRKENINYNTIQFETFENKYERQIPSIYLERFQKPLFNPMFINNRKLLIDKTCNIFIQRYENNRIVSLKKEIKLLTQQNYILSQRNKSLSLNNPNNFKIKNKSFFILGNKLEDKDEKFKIDKELEIKSLKNKNEALLIENNILAERIKDLENLISKNNLEYKNYEHINNINNERKEKNYKDDNEVVDDDDNFEQEEEEEDDEGDTIQKENDDNFFSDDNLKNNINNYDDIYFN